MATPDTSSPRRRPAVATRELKRIRLFAVDVDGTLTDGAMYYDKDGEVLKRFHTRDGHGLAALRKAGIEIAFISGEDSPIVTARARKLGVTRVLKGIKDKLPVLKSLVSKLGLTRDETAYMGDDVNDLECLGWAGISACPADAVDAARRSSRIACRLPGGHGAVREFCDLVIAAKSGGRA